MERYLSDNRNAADWSIYFKSIKTMSSVETGDASVGTVRRCYRGDDEKDAYWDEVTLQSHPGVYRQILTYNLHGFKIDEKNPVQFLVHNRYEKLSETSTKLTFASETLSPDSIFWRSMVWIFDSQAKDTLAKNLANIKAAVEAKYKGTPVVRPYPYLPIGQHYLDEYLCLGEASQK